MSKKVRSRRLLALSAAVAGISSMFSNTEVHAVTTLTWGLASPSNDFSGSWGASAPPNWGQGAGVNWASADVAAFGASNTAANLSVTLANVTAAGLVFNNFTSTYTLMAGTLTLNGSPIVVNNDATINSVIAGAAGIAVTGGAADTITLGGINTVTGASSINSSNVNITGSVALGAALTLGGGNLYTTNGSGDGLTGNMSVVVNNASSTATLNSSNNYTGVTTLTSGHIVVGAAGAITGSAVTVNAGTLTVGAADGLTGGTALTVSNAAAAVTLNASNNFTGATALSAGTLNLASAGAISSSTVTVTGGTLNDSAADALSGTAGLIINAATANITLANSNNYSGVTTITNGTLTLNAAGADSGSTIAVNSATSVLNETAANSISGNAGLTVAITALHTLSLAQSNSYTGLTTLTSGVLNINNDNVLGTGNITFGGVSTLQAGGAFTLNSARTVTLNASSTFDTNGNNDSLASVLTGASLFTKAGAGTLTVTSSGSNNNGGFTIGAGTVVDGANNAISTGGIVTVSASTIFDLGGFNQSLTGLTQAAGSTITTSTSNATLTINDPATAYAAAGVINGTGFTLIKTGAGGTLTLGNGVDTNANNFTGGLVVGQGEVDLDKTAGVSAVGTGTITVGDGTANAATLKLLVAGQIGTTANAMVINSNGTFNLNAKNDTIGTLSMTAGSITIGAATLTLGGNVTATSSGASGIATIGTAATNIINLGTGVRTFTVNSGGGGASADLNVAGVITGTGALYKNGAGILKLSAVDTYTGGTQLATGTTKLGIAAAIPGAATTTLTLGDSSNDAATLDLNGFAQTVTNLAVLGTSTQTITDSGTAATFTYAPTASVNINQVDFTGASLSLAFTAGTTTLSTTGNTWGAGTSVSTNAKLQLGAAGVFSSAANVTLAGGTFDLNGYNATINYIGNPSAASSLITNSISSNQTLTLNNGSNGAGLGGNLTIGGKVVIVQNGGTMLFNGVTDSQTGDYYLSGGTLSTTNDPTVGSGTLHLGSAVISNGGSTGYETITNALSFDGNTTISQTSTQGLDFSGNGTLTGSRTISMGGTQTNQNAMEFSGNIGDGGNHYGFTFTGGGYLLLDPTASNTFSGAVSIINGSLLFFHPYALGNDTGANSTVTLGDANNSGDNTANVGLYADYGTSNINTGGPVTVLNNINIVAGTGTATLGSINSCCSGTVAPTFAGNITFARNLTLNAGSGTGPVTFTGSVSETTANSGMAIINNGPATVVFNKAGDTTGPTFTGGTFVNAGTLQWDYNTTNNDGGNGYSLDQFGGTPSGGPGTITLNGGNFNFSINGATSSSNYDYLMNSIVVTGTGGGLLGYNGDAFQIAGFAGNIALGGALTIGNVTGSSTSNYVWYNDATITLQNNNGAEAAIREAAPVAISTQVVDVIADSTANGGGGPLVLRAAEANFDIEGGNTYTDGSVIEVGAGLVNVISNLGTGNVTLEPGARIRFNSSSNIGSAASVTVASDSNVFGLISVTAPTSIPSLSASSSGVLAVDSSASNNFNMSTIGDGFMRFGTTGSYLYTGSITASSDNIYHLGGGGGTLTFGAGALGGANAVEVGAQYSSQNAAAFGIGTVILTTTNGFSGNITVNPGSTLEQQAVSSANALDTGGVANSLTLRDGTFELLTALSGTTSVASNTSISALTAEGSDSIQFNSPGAATSLTIAGAGGLTRVGQGFLQIIPGTAVLGTGNARVFMTSDPNGIKTATTSIGTGSPVGMLAPWIVDATNAAYVSYGTNGFVDVAPTATNSLSTRVSTDYVLENASDTLTTNTTIAALHFSESTQNVATSITSNAAGYTLTILSGGLTVGASGGNQAESPNIGSTTAANNFTINFGSAEGVINAMSIGGNTNNIFLATPIAGSGGITKTGALALGLGLLTNTSSTFTGLITVDQGLLAVADNTALGNAANNILIDGGELGLDGLNLPSARSISIGAAGGEIGTVQQSYVDGGINTGTGGSVAGIISDASSGGGVLRLSPEVGNNLTISGANTYTKGTVIDNGGTVIVASGADLGTGDVSLIGANLTIQAGANNAIASTAQLDIASTYTVTFQNSAPTIGNLQGAGSVVLGNTAVNTTLTVGGSNTAGVFSGAITTFAGVTTGLTKVGTGTLALLGSNTYTGQTTITGGVLEIDGSVQGLVNVGTSGTLGGGGVSYGSVYVAAGGTVAPGDPNTFTANGATTSLSAGSNLTWNLNAASSTIGQGVNDLLQVNSASFYLGSTGTLNALLYPSTAGSFTLGAGNAPVTYTLIDFTGSLVSAAGDLTGSATSNVTLSNSGLPSQPWLIDSFTNGVTTTLSEKMVLYLTPTSSLGGSLDLVVAAATPSISLSTASLALFSRPNVGTGATSSNTYTVSTSLTNITSTNDAGVYSMSVLSGSGVTFSPTTGTLLAAPNAGTSTVISMAWSSAAGVTSAGARAATITVADLTNPFDASSETESLSGGVYNVATATIASTLANIGLFHTNNTAQASLTITNTNLFSTSYQDQLSVGNVGIGSSATVSSLGLINAGASGILTYTVNTGAAGPVAILNTLSLTSSPTVSLAAVNLGSVTISTAGTAYNYASPSLSVSSINFGSLRTSSVSTVANLSVSNSVISNAAYQDSLSVGLTGTGNTNVVASGSPFVVTAGNGQQVNFTATLAQAGSLNGNETLSLVSTNSLFGAGGSHSLGATVVNITGGVYNYANAQLSTTTVAFGNYRTAPATSATSNLAITNSVVSNASYQDQLNVTSAGSASVSVGSITGLNPGSTQNLGFTASLGAAGSISGTETLSLVSSPTVALSSQTTFATISVSGGVYDYANPLFNSISNIDFGTVRAGTPVSQTLNITNSTVSNPLFQDSLSVSGTSSNASVVITPTASPIVAGSTGVVGFGSSASGGGSLAGTTTLALVSTTTVAGLTSSTTTVDVTTTGSAYDYANAQLASTLVDLGVSRTGAGTTSQNLAITNSVISNASYQDQLNVSGSGSSPATVGSISGLNAGSSSNLGFTASLATAGNLGGTETLNLVSNPTVALSGRTTYATVSVTGGVYDYANASLPALGTVSLGNFHVGTASVSSNVAVTNTVVTSASYQDELSVTGNNPSANISVGSINNLAAGSSANLGFTVINPSTAGALTGTTTLALQSVPTVSLTGRTTYATVSVSGGIYNYATGSVDSSVNLNDAFVSASVASSAVNVANTSPNAYSDALDAYGSASSGITAGNATGIAGGASSTINVAADTSFSHLGGGTVTVGLVSNGTAEGLGTTSVGSATVSVTGGNVYQHAVLIDPPVTIRVTQGDTASTTYSISDLASSPLRDSALVSTVTVNNANITTTASGMLPTTIAPGSSTVYSVSYASTSSVDSTAGNLAFTYGDLQTGLAGANNNNQTLTVSVNAVVDPIVEVAQLSGSTASINTAPDRIAAGNAKGFIGTVAPSYLAAGQYNAGVLTEANMYNATGHAEGVVEVNVAPPTAALEPTTLLLFDFFNGAAETSAQSTGFSELTQDLSTFGYTYSTDTTTGALNFYDTNALYKPVGYTYELEVDLDSGPIAGMNPSQIDFNFSKYDLQVDNLLAVPEPTTIGLVGALGTGLLARRRKSTQKRRKA